MTIFFTADHHAGHANAIQSCNRPFLDIDEMDFFMVRRWNERVKSTDVVYHLGDLTLWGRIKADDFLNQLNGHIRILGNNWHHDARWLKKAATYTYHSRSADIVILPALVVLEFPQYSPDGKHSQVITLCHYPMARWERSSYGGWHLHGHSHGNYVYPPGTLALDVGVDVHNFYPISLEEVAQVMKEKEREV